MTRRAGVSTARFEKLIWNLCDAHHIIWWSIGKQVYTCTLMEPTVLQTCTSFTHVLWARDCLIGLDFEMVMWYQNLWGLMHVITFTLHIISGALQFTLHTINTDAPWWSPCTHFSIFNGGRCKHWGSLHVLRPRSTSSGILKFLDQKQGTGLRSFQNSLCDNHWSLWYISGSSLHVLRPRSRMKVGDTLCSYYYTHYMMITNLVQ